MATCSGTYLHALLTGPPGVGKTTLIKKVCAVVAKKRGDVKMSGFYTEEVREGGGRVGFDVVTLQGERAILARVSGVSQGHSVTEGATRRPREASPTVGRYQVDVTSFETIALPALEYKSTKTPVALSKVRGNSSVPDSPKILETGPPGRKTTSAYSSTLDTGVKSGKRDELPVQLHMRDCLVVIDEIGKMELFSKSFVASVEGLFENMSNEWRVVLATIPVAGRGKSHWLLEELRHRRNCRLFQVTEKNRDSLVQEVSDFVLQRLTAAQ